MTSMGLQTALAILLLFPVTVKAAEGGVTFWRDKFTMTCPDNGTWYSKDNTEPIGAGWSLELKYENSKKGRYHCDYDTKYYFYVQGKVCENCFELEASVFGLVILLDLLVTVFVMIVIYRCTNNKSSAGPPYNSKAPARSGGRGPPVPSPDYEQLSPHTRSQDPYAMVNRR